ncbi:MAG TPA: ABC transporter permease [Thermoanaerobaculia bacterium]|jgi:predicted permease|nr:ABC transporter permease [Thermoanaerobaculia bacterium]
MTSLLHNLRYAVRTLLRTPAFTVVALVTLALGIGANTAIFSLVNGVLLRPLPYPKAAELVQLERGDKDGRSTSVSIPKFVFWRDHSGDVFRGVAAYEVVSSGFNMAGDGPPERIAGSRVTRDFFSVFGRQPEIGRGFSPEEDRPGGAKVVVLGHELWARRFGADRALVGRPVVLNGEPYTVVGIMPAGFHFPSVADLWAPLAIDPASREKANYLEITARLRSGVSRQQAAAALGVVAGQYRTQRPDDMGDTETVVLQPLQERLYGQLRPALLVLLAAVAFVLGIACVNVANLQLARAAARRREVAVRTALGAGAGRIFGQLLTESLVLSVAGGLSGLLLGYWILKPLLALSPVDALGLSGGGGLPPVGIDGNVLAFTFGLSLLSGLLFGLVPAIQMARADLREPLQENSTRSTGGPRGALVRRLLVVSEVALALVLITGATLLVRSFSGLTHTAPGFRPEGVLTVKLSLPASRYASPQALERFSREVTERVGGLPGVRQAAMVSTLPLEPGPDLPFVVVGKWPGGDSHEGIGGAQYRVATAGYFKALGIPLAKGRYLDSGDRSGGELVAVVNETLARRYFPKQDPLSQRIHVGMPFTAELADPAPRRIVGVVKDVREAGLDEAAPPILYIPMGQLPAPVAALLVRLLPVSLVVQTDGSPAALTQQIQKQIWAVDPQQPVSAVAPMTAVIDRSLGSRRFSTVLLGSLALLALALSSVGIYGVLSYLVSQRTREIGVRMALGATGRHVLQMVIGQGLVPVLFGVAAGLVGAFALTRLLASLLVGVSARDPLTFALAPAVLTAVALLASAIPAHRASQMDPLVALRSE